jgi:hypothetical protein
MPKTIQLPPLWLCLLLDAIGIASYFIPIWGEWMDVMWGPLSACWFYYLFGGKTGVVGAVVSFVEESLPFADIIPMFTIGYFIRKRELLLHSKTDKTYVEK